VDVRFEIPQIISGGYKMRLFIDTVKREVIEKYAGIKIFSGVTTTPTFFRAEGITDINKEIRRISEFINGEIHIEALGNTAQEIIENARSNARIAPNVVSKIPISQEGLKAVVKLSEEGIKTNVHLIFSLNQALMAGLAGATYVCPLVGRLYDIGHDGLGLIKEIIMGFRNYPEIKSKIMVSSVRTPEHVKIAIMLGADAITIPDYVIELMFNHPLTSKGIEIFEQDNIMNKFVRDLMHTGSIVPKVNEDTSIKDVIIEITKKNLGLTTVINKEEKLSGIITDGDIRRAIQNNPNIYEIQARNLMNVNPKTISKDVLVSEALKNMRKFGITQLIILGINDEPFGLIHIHDILKQQYSK